MRLIGIILLAWGGATIAAVPADDPAQRGLAIALEADRRDQGFSDTTVELTMTLSNPEGRIRTRRLTWQILEKRAADEGDRSLTVFHEPRDIAGTGFLSHTYIEREDDQWIYLPALKRVKRIASANKSSAFVGSEFAYEDLLSDEVEKFTYRWLREAPCAELACHIIERIPRYPDTGYSRQEVWIDQTEYRPIRIDYYDRKERLAKTLSFEQYQLYSGQFWRARRLQMQNHFSGKRTVLAFDVFEFRTGLTAQAFDPGALRRLR